MLTIDNNTHCVRLGDSLTDVANYLRSTPRVWPMDASESTSPSISWDLYAGYAGACKMAAEGWSEGAAQVSRDLRAMPAPLTQHTKLTYDVAGHYADVPKYLTGLPDNMVRHGKVAGNKPVIHIVVNGAIMGGITSNETKNFGLACAGIVDQLEASGRRVELTVAFCSTSINGTRRMISGWRVKEAGEHLDLSSIAFSLAHPAAFRRLGFALRERMPAHIASNGYGRSTQLNEKDLALLGFDGAVIMNGVADAISECDTKAGALAFAINSINKAAGEDIVELAA